jgi:hypothetical protein
LENAGTGGEAGSRNWPGGRFGHARSFQVMGVAGSSSGSKATSRPNRGSPGSSWMMKYQPQSSFSVCGCSSPLAVLIVRSNPKKRRSGSTSAANSGKRISVCISAADDTGRITGVPARSRAMCAFWA